MLCLTHPGAPHAVPALREPPPDLEVRRQITHILLLRILWHDDFPIVLEVHNMDLDDDTLESEDLGPTALELQMEIVDLRMLACPVSTSSQ